MRKIAAAVVITAVAALGLTACSDIPSQVMDCKAPSTSGSASESVTAHGAFGADPKASVPTPLHASRVESSTLIKGKGLELGPDDIARVQATLYDSTTGTKIAATIDQSRHYTKSTPILETISTKAGNFWRYLSCQTVGSRVVTILKASDYYGSAAVAKQQGKDPTDVYALVTDITSGMRGRATGAQQPEQPGFPSVVTSGNGTPGVTFDLQEPPKTPQTEVIRAGSGAVVKAGQSVLLQVQAIAWTDPVSKDTFDSTWSTETPRLYTLTAYAANSDGYSLDKSSVKALVGQKVGSQVLVVVPSKYGYPSKQVPTGYPTGETEVFVFDILGTL